MMMVVMMLMIVMWSDLFFRPYFSGERVRCAECIGGWLWARDGLEAADAGNQTHSPTSLLSVPTGSLIMMMVIIIIIIIIIIIHVFWDINHVHRSIFIEVSEGLSAYIFMVWTVQEELKCLLIYSKFLWRLRVPTAIILGIPHFVHLGIPYYSQNKHRSFPPNTLTTRFYYGYRLCY
jgi:hypothetical protein